MQVYKVYTIYDSKTQSYSKPFYSITRGSAIRSFQSVTADPSTDINRYPQDFALFELGSYNDSTSQFVLHAAPEHIGLACDLAPPA